MLVNWRNWEVATLVRSLVGKVSAFFLAAGVPSSFRAVDEMVGSVLFVLIADIIKNEKINTWEGD